MVMPARISGARLLIPTCPSWIMKPKIPEKVPRSLRLNQAALILIIPGEPKRWKVPVDQPDQRERGERAGKRGKAVNEVDSNGPRRADDHRGASANAVTEQAVNQLPHTIGDRPPGEDLRDLRVVEMELFDHAGRGKAEVIPAEVKRGVSGS